MDDTKEAEKQQIRTPFGIMPSILRKYLEKDS